MARKSASSRSASRGRAGNKSPSTPKRTPKPTPKAKSAAKSAAKSTAKKAKSAAVMAFEEGDRVMARWPGTSLYFKAKVTYVRDDDNEYDVQYEDGTIFTIKARDVKKGSSSDFSASGKKKTTPSRSRSRGRSPGRKSKASPARSPKTKEEASSPARRSSRSARKAPVKAAPKPEFTPTRTSARIAQSKVNLSSDEDDGRKAIPNPAHPKRGKKSFFSGINVEWLKVSFFMLMGPLILISLHKLCQGGSCQLAVPKISRNWRDYWNLNSFLALNFFNIGIKILSLVPVGNRVRTGSGNEVRLNGFVTLLAVLVIFPALVYRKADLSFVTKNYWNLVCSALLLSIIQSAVVFFMARFGRRTNANPKGNSGNLIIDFFYGREFNPFFLGGDIKLLTFRISMIGLAVLNIMLVLDNLNGRFGNINWAVVMPAAFQVMYALDAMFFEEYFFFSHDAMNSGYGFSLSSSYLTFPFIPTLITRYMIAKNPTLTSIQLFFVFLLHIVGYLIFRTAETQRCEFAKNSNNPSLRHLDTISAGGSKKILCGGYWGLVRYPNYLGHILIMWSWVMAAVPTAGRVDLLIYYLPVFTTLTLLNRCSETNAKNKRKYGSAWNTYTERVKSNVIPFIY